MDWLSELSQTLSNPAMKHAMFVHWPIVLGGIGAVLALLVAITGATNRSLQWLAVAAFVALTVAGFMAMKSGEDAQNAIRGALPAGASPLLDRHEGLAQWVWMFGAGLALVMSMTFLKQRGAKLGAAWIGVLASALAMAWIATVAHLGGRLVYEFGVGAGPASASSSRDSDSAPMDNARPSSADSSPGAHAPPGDAQAELSPAEAFFVNEVRPLMQAHCWKCHNPERLKGGLDQTTREALLRGGNSGPVIIIGRPQESRLIAALKYENEDLQMPPKGRLGDDQIAVFERWIADGAAWADVGDETVPGELVGN